MKLQVPIPITTAVNPASRSRSVSIGIVEAPSKEPRSPSTAYVTGSINVKMKRYAGRSLIGKRAPLKKNIGNIKKLDIN